MASWRSLGCLVGAVLWLLAAPVSAGEACKAGGSVSLVILESRGKVYEYARSVARGVPVVASSPSTVVFRDGRVITSDVENAGRQLNQLGWGERRIDVVASFARHRARPAPG